MEGFKKISDFIVKACDYVIVAIFGSMTLIFFSSIISRYLIGSGWHGSEEFTRFGMIWLVFITAVVITKKDEHLSITYLESKLKNVMTKKVLKLIQRLIMMAYMILLSGISFQMLELGARQTSPSMGIAMNYVYMVFPASFVFIVIQLAFLTISEFTNKEGQEN